MPRERSRAGQNANYESPRKAVQIPLNDDRVEKAQRLQSRQAIYSKQMDQLKAAASPARKRRSLGAGPSTPSHEDGPGVAGSAVTPMKRVPILANFEEWMKMATDNKINATNSWNFALIDYFHDMSLLREGDSVNFQKASCTLDGCVKIYTSRVDSVATETGKLLSGLADSGNKKKRRGEEGEEGEGVDGEEDEDGDEGAGKKSRKRKARNAEATLATSFDQLRLKKMELEFSVDPLFKKASADFDEGGAKGLLLNHLSIDGAGRIVFDSSDDLQDEGTEEERRDSMEPEGEQEREKSEPEPVVEEQPIDLGSLASRFFPDLTKLDDQVICPSLQTFELGSGDNAMDLPFLKAPDNWRDEHPAPSGAEQDGEGGAEGDDVVPFGTDDDDDDAGGAADFDLPLETGFGEGGEAWARDAALQPQNRVYNIEGGGEGGEEGGEVGTFDTNANGFGVHLQHRDQGNDHENILNYFDTAMHKNWAGPEHWRIAKIKDAQKPKEAPKPRKEKEPFEVDFASPMSPELATALYTTAASNAVISLPKKDWRSRTRNLLPDDKHFNSKDLLKLFLKPKAKIGSRSKQSQGPSGDAETDEAYWATHNNNNDAGVDAPQPHPADDNDGMGYNADFFADDNLPLAGLPAGTGDEDTFADAREDFSPAGDDVDTGVGGPHGPGIDAVAGGSQATFGENLVMQSRRSRPEYVQYARVAKKVDVRRLKEEMWRGIGLEVCNITPLRCTTNPTPSRFPGDLPPQHQQTKPNQAETDHCNRPQPNPAHLRLPPHPTPPPPSRLPKTTR